MGSSSSSVIETVEKLAKSVGDGIKSIKLPDNPLKDVSFGNKLRNFGKGVSSGIRGPKQVSVQVRTGPFGFGRATQMRSVSSTPMSVSGIAGDFVGHKISRIGRTGEKPIFSSNKPKLNSVIPSTTPSFVERMKQTFKPIKTTKTTNIGNIELSNMSQQPQQPQQPLEQQQGGNKKTPSKKEKTPSKKEKTPSKKEKTPSKKEKTPSKKEKKTSEKETTLPKKEKTSSKKEKKTSKK